MLKLGKNFNFVHTLYELTLIRTILFHFGTLYAYYIVLILRTLSTSPFKKTALEMFEYIHCMFALNCINRLTEKNLPAFK